MPNIGVCVKCRQLENNESLSRLQGHHLFPKRSFGSNGENPITLPCCCEHHDEIERLIRLAELATNGDRETKIRDPGFYLEFHEKYLGKEAFKMELSKQLSRIRRNKRHKGKIFVSDSLLWHISNYCTADSLS